MFLLFSNAAVDTPGAVSGSSAGDSVTTGELEFEDMEIAADSVGTGTSVGELTTEDQELFGLSLGTSTTTGQLDGPNVIFPATPRYAQATPWGANTSPGLESIFMYNGLKLNDRSKPERYHLTSITGFGWPDVKMRELERSDDHGTLKTVSEFSGRTINITGRIQASTHSKLKQMMFELFGAFSAIDKENALYIQSPFVAERFIMCRKISSIAIRETQAGSQFYTREFTINLKASDPRIFALDFSTATFTWTTSATQQVVVNRGNFPAWVRLRVGATGASVTDPRMTTIPTSVFSYTGTINNKWIMFDYERKTMIDNNNNSVLDKGWGANITEVSTPLIFPENWYPGYTGTVTTSAASLSGSPTGILYWRDTWI